MGSQVRSTPAQARAASGAVPATARSLLSQTWPTGEKVIAERVNGEVRFRVAAPPPAVTVVPAGRSAPRRERPEVSPRRAHGAERG